jgi:hypothetical protein
MQGADSPPILPNRLSLPVFPHIADRLDPVLDSFPTASYLCAVFHFALFDPSTGLIKTA